MANAIKQRGADGTPRLQVTRPARAADLVEEEGEGDEKRTTYRAHVRVHAFDGLLLIGDYALEDASLAYLVRKASKYTDSGGAGSASRRSRRRVTSTSACSASGPNR